MKHLTLIRHAEAAPAEGKTTDFERSLNNRGLHEANSIGQQLAQQGFLCDQLFCSAAQRTLTTAQIIYGALKSNDRPVLADQSLYHCGADSLYRFTEMIDDDIQHAVIVAHNPGLSDLANMLLRQPIHNMSTCTVVQIQLNIDNWIDIQAHCAMVLTINTPL
jgi:phosphohistidine phosphatase